MSDPTAERRFPVSYAQQLLCVFDAGEEDSGPFGPRHNITWSWRVRGAVDAATLVEAMGDVVARHEALRTRIVRDGDDLYQSVVPPSPARLSEVDLSGVAPEARDRRTGGAGLGLAIVSALIAAHGGTVGVNTSPGHGATFWITLPLDPEATERPDAAPAG